jgi:hypothetical protein
MPPGNAIEVLGLAAPHGLLPNTEMTWLSTQSSPTGLPIWKYKKGNGKWEGNQSRWPMNVLALEPGHPGPNTLGVVWSGPEVAGYHSAEASGGYGQGPGQLRCCGGGGETGYEPTQVGGQQCQYQQQQQDWGEQARNGQEEAPQLQLHWAGEAASSEQGGAGSSTINQESSVITPTTPCVRSKRRDRAIRARGKDYNAMAETLYQVDPLHYEQRDTNGWKQMWPYCRLCRMDVWENHENTKRHKIRLFWEANAWDWSADDKEPEMNEADQHELDGDWSWEPPGIRWPVVLEVRNVNTPLMTREEADAKLYKREIVEYLLQVASKTLVRDWKLTGSVDAIMRRTSREYLLDAVEAAQAERDQPFATVKQRPGGTANATGYGQNNLD